MGILRADRVSGLGGANAIKGSVEMRGAQNLRAEIVNGNADFNLGSSDFTIECWYNPSGTTGTSNSLDVDLLMLWNNTNNRRSYGLYYDSSGSLGLIGSTDGTNADNQSFHSYTFSDLNAWYHIAVVRISNTATVYVNGAVLGSATVSTFYENTVDNLVVGGQLAGTSYDSKIARGFISNMRLIIGDGIYTGAFTPPANELTVTPNTKLLCCQSPGNILQEATGKTLVAYRSSANDSFAKASTFVPDKGEDYGTTFVDNTKFDTLSYMVPPGGTTAESNRGRGAFAGGETPSKVNSIEYINIQSMGTAKDFGDLTITCSDVKGLGSSTRGVFRVDNNPSARNVLEYITFATTSNATDFGDLVIAVQQRPGAGNQTRGIFSGGLYPGSTMHNAMDYVTIATAGNATDFGDLTVTRGDTSALASPTRMLVGGGITNPGSATYHNEMDYVTIATTGNATDFGDLTVAARSGTAVASSTRGVFGPAKAPSLSNTIDYVTIATTGNATDFGDALLARGGAGSASNSIRGLFAGGYSPSLINGIEFINIATTGNGADFGDMTYVSQYGGGCSDSHGGIS